MMLRLALEASVAEADDAISIFSGRIRYVLGRR